MTKQCSSCGGFCGKVCQRDSLEYGYGYASRLAIALSRQHFPEIAPEFQLLDTLSGVLTQIDNMTCGLVRPVKAAIAQEPVTLNEFNPDWNENAALVEEIQDLALELEQTKKDFLMQTDAAMELLKTVDRARGLLERCLDEMQYAGWNQPIKDNFNRWSVFSAVLNYLHPPVKGDSK